MCKRQVSDLNVNILPAHLQLREFSVSVLSRLAQAEIFGDCDCLLKCNSVIAHREGMYSLELEGSSIVTFRRIA
jgi:hypothetical protein